MSEICGEVNSVKGLTCTKEPHPFGPHIAFENNLVIAWPGKEIPAKPTQRTVRGARPLAVVQNARDAGRLARTGPPEGHPHHASGPPQEAVEAWNRGSWVETAKAALREVCQTHQEFSNKAVWAMVDNPAERRAMTVVTRYGIAQGWMAEVSAYRENEHWVTRDGVSFPLNKLVPTYRSLIYRGES